jgi:hypothetical protein
MPKLNGMGPENQGKKTGRGLGRCQVVSENEMLTQLGLGRGKRHQSRDCEGNANGRGKRLKSGLQ